MVVLPSFKYAHYPLLLGFTLYGVADLVRRYIRFYTTPLRKIPGPPRRSFWLGYFFTILKAPFMGPHKQWLKDIAKANKDVPFLSYSSLFGRWSLLVLDPDFVRVILTDPSASRDPVRFRKNYFFLKTVVGDGLVTAEGNTWSRHRRIIQPAFQTSFLREAIDKVVTERVQFFIDAWKKAEGSTIDVTEHISALTLDVIGQIAFSYDFGGTKVIEDWAEQAADTTEEQALENISDPLLKSFKASFKVTGLGIFVSLLNMPWLYKYLNRKRARTVKLLNQAVDDVVRSARARGISNIGSTNKSLLQMLIEAADSDGDTSDRKNFSDLELRDETKTFLVAGHETTSALIHWALYALAIYPDAQENVFTEICKHAPDESRPISVSQVAEMPFLRAFLQETLRLYSPVGMIARFNAREEHWKGYKLPKGTRLVIPIHLLHQHPNHWNKPDEFLPERWLHKEENEARHKFAFIPFSAGLRNCIGQRFAELEAKVIFANIARAFRVELAPCMREEKITYTQFISMKSKPPVKICVKTR